MTRLSMDSEALGGPGLVIRCMFLLDLGKVCLIHNHNTGKRNPTKNNCRGDEQTGEGHGSRAQYGCRSKNFYKITKAVSPNCGLDTKQRYLSPGVGFESHQQPRMRNAWMAERNVEVAPSVSKLSTDGNFAKIDGTIFAFLLTLLNFLP